MTPTIHERGICQYRSDTPELILADLRKNPISHRKGSWEQGRMRAIEKELQTRKAKL